MILQYFVTEEASGKIVPIEIDRATTTDLATTKSCWQSDWTSDFISDPNLEKYAAKPTKVKLSPWVRTEKMKAVFLFISLILKLILRATLRSPTLKSILASVA